MLVYLKGGSAQIILSADTEMEVADQTFFLTRAQYTNSGPTSPRADLIAPGAWQGSHWGANWYDSTRGKKTGERERERER